MKQRKKKYGKSKYLQSKNNNPSFPVYRNYVSQTDDITQFSQFSNKRTFNTFNVVFASFKMSLDLTVLILTRT